MNRGRGRGRGAGGPRPVARDDEGNLVEMKAEGPPANYPQRELPKIPQHVGDLNVEYDSLVSSFSTVNGSFMGSSFFLGDVKEKHRRASANASLASVVTLDPNYFPRELRGGSKQAQAAYWANQSRIKTKEETDDLALNRLEELAKKEDMRGGTAEGAARDGPLLGNVGDEYGEEEEAYDDDEDFVGDEDDPYQQFDDDEGYDDPDDDGGGDEAFF